MTAQQYTDAYRRARATYPKLTRSAMKRLKTVYTEAADRVAEIIRHTEAANLSELTSGSWRQIEHQLQTEAEKLREALRTQTQNTVESGIDIATGIQQKYLFDVVGISGGKLTQAGITNMFSSVNRRLVSSMVNRVYTDGYTFSDRIWGAGEAMQESIKSVLTEGIAMGRDPIAIADDLGAYVKSGRKGLATRYGKLTEGSDAWTRRIRKDIDYNALRIVRSELYQSVQDADALSARMNPGSTGEVDWIRGDSETCNSDPSCQELADGSPYPADDVPDYPHPNCCPGETLISTTRGNIPINKILPGEMVLTHDGSFQQATHIWKQKYIGDLINIETVNNKLSITPEHPIMTNGSWLFSKDIKIRDNILSVRDDIEPLSFIKTISKNSPSLRFKKGGFFRILSLLSGAGMPIPAIDFNGHLYIFENKIYSISTANKIRERLISFVKQSIVEQGFIWRPKRTGIKLSYAGLMFVRIMRTTDGIMCGDSISLPAVGVTSMMAFGDGWGRKSEANKPFGNTSAGDVKDFSYLVDREISILKKVDKFRDIKYNFFHNSAIVNVSFKKVNTIVYNLTVNKNHSYIANGIVTHNCLCYLVPRLRDSQDFRDDVKAWVNGEDVGYMDDWYDNYYSQSA